MKKTLVTLSLALIIVSSLVAGTLAMYSTRVDNVAEGSVVAKEFKVVTTAKESFKKDIKIAPSETVSMVFAVSNFEGAIITETKMNLAISVSLAAADGKTAITPLTISVKKGGKTIGTVAGGVVSIADTFELDTVGQTYEYTVEVVWPSNDAIDNNFIGANFGSVVKVSMVATQA
ncbi:MAG: hypothetical protein RR357_05845 [Clostridia bacterium]